MKRRNFIKQLAIAASIAAIGLGSGSLYAQQKTVKIGVLHSLSGTMYAFFHIAGVDDSLAFCKRLMRDARLGLAPGSAFGPRGEGFLRWCFAASEERLAQGLERLRQGLVRMKAA